MHTSLTNVAHSLQLRAESTPLAPAIIVPHHNITKTFRQLNEESNSIALNFSKLGIKQGTRTLLMLKPGAELITIVFALFKLGAVPIIIDPGMGIKNFLKCIQSSTPNVLIANPLVHALSRILFPFFSNIKHRIFVCKNQFLQSLAPAPNITLPTVPPFSLAAILFTSGSTGAPKGVCYTHEIFSAQLSSLRNDYNISTGEIDIPMLPIFALFNPALGMTTLIPKMNPSRPANINPKKIVDAILKYHVTNSFGSPILWHKIADYCEINTITLPSIKRIFMAGCSVPIELIKRYQKIIPNGIVHTPYGATEALPISSISTNQILNQHQTAEPSRGTCVGSPLPHNQIKIIKITDTQIAQWDPLLELNSGEIGEIIVQGPVVTKEYLNLPETTQKSKISDGSHFWHRMGDLGFLDNNGLLWFCGRKIERVPIPSGTLFTDCCENIINQHPSVYRSALINCKKKSDNFPAIVIQTHKHAWPKSKKAKQLLLTQIRALARSYPITSSIDHFFIHKKFPVDVRHNAKIHRLTLAKYFSK